MTLAEPLPLDPIQPRRQLAIEAGIVFAFWACIFALTVAQRLSDPRNVHEGAPPGLLEASIVSTALDYLVWLLLTPLVFYLARRFTPERDGWAAPLAVHVGAALAISLAMDAYGRYLFFEFIAPFLERRKFHHGNHWLSLDFLDELIVYLTVLAAGFARVFFLRYQERQAEAAMLRTRAVQLQAQLAEARLEALDMQLNPHFLFNTLNTISTYVERDPRTVRRMIARLGELLRYTLERTGAREIPLRQELEFLDRYLEIQRLRFQDALRVEMDVAPDVRDALVPNLVLQPLVENAIRHGVERTEGGGRIVLRARRAGERLIAEVEDDGPGLTPGAPEGVGLGNTRARLAGLYGPAAALELLPGPAGGLIARVTLPYHTADDLYVNAEP